MSRILKSNEEFERFKRNLESEEAFGRWYGIFKVMMNLEGEDKFGS